MIQVLDRPLTIETESAPPSIGKGPEEVEARGVANNIHAEEED
jgi:hypothetical protein